MTSLARRYANGKIYTQKPKSIPVRQSKYSRHQTSTSGLQGIAFIEQDNWYAEIRRLQSIHPVKFVVLTELFLQTENSMLRQMKLSLPVLSVMLVLASLIAWPRDSFAEPPRGVDCVATELLPSSIVACAEVSDLGEALETVLKHPLRSKLEAMPAYDGFIQSGAPAKIQTGLRAFEATMGKPWQEAMETLTDRGITIALDASDGGVAILVHSSDADSLERFRGFVLAFRQMQGATAKQGEYRGFTADLVGDKWKMVRIHDWLLLTNNAELGKSIIDQYLDRNGDSLETNTTYAAAQKSIDLGDREHSTVSAYVDIEPLRDAGFAKSVFNEKIDNIVGEVALGGVLANLRHTSFVTGQFNIRDAGLSLRLATPHQRDWEAPREYFFGEPQLAAAPSLLDVENRLFAVSTHRDLSQMWLRSGDLVSDRAVDQLAVADTTLTTFFSGRDFGEDILGSLESEIQIVGMEQDFTDVLPQPAIKLPAFAVQFRMKNPDETQPELRRVFQSFIGFLNVTGAQNGQPQFDLGMETVGDAQLVTATYVPEKGARESRDAKIQFNFSPTLAFAGERIVFASSTALARKLIESPSGNKHDNEVGSQAGVPNTIGRLETTTLQRILETNRPQLIANSMLEKGHSKQAAEDEIALLLELIGFLRDVRLNLNVTESQMTLGLAVDVTSDSEAQ
ncbi:hypothetical protein [Rubripirellula tenax]|nr:hypothetical protein [Rubripirellula tenax]